MYSDFNHFSLLQREHFAA